MARRFDVKGQDDVVKRSSLLSPREEMPVAMTLQRMRKFERIAVNLPVYVSTPSQGHATESVRARELGEGGCLLLGTDFFGVGRILTLDIAMGSRPVRAIAKVLYEYRNGAGEVCSGAEFQFVSEDNSHRLQHYVGERLEDDRVVIA